MPNTMNWWKSLSPKQQSLLEINFIFNFFPEETIRLSISTGEEIDIFEVFDDHGLEWHHFRGFCSSKQQYYVSQHSIFNFKALDIHHIKHTLIQLYGENCFESKKFITDLTTMKRLYIAYSELQTIDFIYPLSALQLIDISYNSIEDISVFKNFSQLQNIYLDHNYIKSIADLKNLKHLQEITFINNEIEKIAPLISCQKLKYINSFNNTILDFKKLTQLTHLKHLNLGLNSIEDISFIKTLPFIETLELAFNKINDITPINELSCLKYLNLYSNPYDNKRHHINILKQKGITNILTENEYNRYTGSYLSIPYYNIST